jgi:hypothetical protein
VPIATDVNGSVEAVECKLFPSQGSVHSADHRILLASQSQWPPLAAASYTSHTIRDESRETACRTHQHQTWSRRLPFDFFSSANDHSKDCVDAIDGDGLSTGRTLARIDDHRRVSMTVDHCHRLGASASGYGFSRGRRKAVRKLIRTSGMMWGRWKSMTERVGLKRNSELKR